MTPEVSMADTDLRYDPASYALHEDPFPTDRKSVV